MKRSLALSSFFLTLPFVLSLFFAPGAQAASDLADGTYTVDYTIVKAENESASMANDYFEKPATLQVNKGEITAQIQMNHSKWITMFKVPDKGDFADAKVIKSDENEDTRVVEFKLDDLSKPLLSKIHVTVESINYDHDYTIRFIFDTKKLKKVESAAKAASDKAGASTAAAEKTGADKGAKAGATAPAASTKPVATADAAKQPADKVMLSADNPQTGDQAPLAFFTALFFISACYLVRSLQNHWTLKGENPFEKAIYQSHCRVYDDVCAADLRSGPDGRSQSCAC
ncbi:heme uptake protein IsdC [Paenibacillus oleatilyticus]|uniref:heme uptake protein IsdC n=1 Tax=Paenibacillus oleatilyticus TaxID=2594886 RepID=UPI001C1FA5C2|nr:heme uptake protein IsdC [Paenibacillus oleatilyticus]MBU7318483.1 heme uptake protein IsdC [Paenibacillus oleatilyticus]